MLLSKTRCLLDEAVVRRDAHEVVPFISNRGEDSWHILGGDVASSGGMESS
jgi:hypothetical protein